MLALRIEQSCIVYVRLTYIHNHLAFMVSISCLLVRKFLVVLYGAFFIILNYVLASPFVYLVSISLMDAMLQVIVHLDILN